ncbi:Transposon Tf2-9 poly [Paramuricea clavata]|uniref:Transposon Tf2-9 poly n=1 Tax=Paramuricea clavata TaxID=317549 RepID=A0A6S7IT04_PARCT|nr:Transposon Tf2-9 poly [Paramuricea clavata]
MEPTKRKLDSETVYDIDFSRKIYRKQKKKIPNCGFVCLLSDEKLDQKESTGTIISPIKEHPVSLTEIFNRAERVKQNLIVDEQERTNITNAMKKQSKSKEWYLHRHVRITASKCKQALLGIQDGHYIFACFLKQVSKQVERSSMLTEYGKFPSILLFMTLIFCHLLLSMTKQSEKIIDEVIKLVSG